MGLGSTLGTIGGAGLGMGFFGPLGAVGGGLLGNEIGGSFDSNPNAELGQSFINNSPRPGTLNYNAPYNPSSMGMSGQFNPNTQGLNAFRGEALRTGPSRGSQLQMGQQNLMQTQGRNQAARDVAGSNANARSQLAMRGGLTSGATERIAKSGKRDLMSAQQNLQAQKMGNAANIGIQDENSRMSQLAMLPGLENQALQPGMQSKMFDVTNQMKSNMGKNDFDMRQYEAQMKAFENAQQANAMLNSSGKGGFLSGIFG